MGEAESNQHQQVADALAQLAAGQIADDTGTGDEELLDTQESESAPTTVGSSMNLPSALPAPRRAGESVQVAQPAAAVARYQTLDFRRTVIPILLTCGMISIALACTRYIADPDSPFADLPGPLAILLITVGVILIALAVLNMMSIRQALTAR